MREDVVSVYLEPCDSNSLAIRATESHKDGTVTFSIFANEEAVYQTYQNLRIVRLCGPVIAYVGEMGK